MKKQLILIIIFSVLLISCDNNPPIINQTATIIDTSNKNYVVEDISDWIIVPEKDVINKLFKNVALNPELDNFNLSYHYSISSENTDFTISSIPYINGEKGFEQYDVCTIKDNKILNANRGTLYELPLDTVTFIKWSYFNKADEKIECESRFGNLKGEQTLIVNEKTYNTQTHQLYAYKREFFQKGKGLIQFEDIGVKEEKGLIMTQYVLED